jgi:hypothetical protein
MFFQGFSPNISQPGREAPWSDVVSSTSAVLRKAGDQIDGDAGIHTWLKSDASALISYRMDGSNMKYKI